MRKVLLLVALLAALAACDNPFQTNLLTAPPAAPASVYAFGDSNLYLAADEIVSTYPPEWSARAHGVGGDRITTPDWAATRIDSDVGSLPSSLHAVVVQLGTNDCEVPAGVVPNLTGVPAGIDAIMGKFPSTVTVHWNNVRVPAGNYYCLGVNVMLGQATGRWSNLVIEDYASHIASNPTYLPGPDPHMSQAGQDEYAHWTKSYVS